MHGHHQDLEAEVRGLRERISEARARLETAQAKLARIESLHRGYRMLVECYEMQLAGLKILEQLDDDVPSSATMHAPTGPLACAT